MTLLLDPEPAVQVRGEDPVVAIASRPHHKPSAAPRRLATAAAFTAVFGSRLAVLHHGGEPSGVDFGNWLALGHSFLGNPVAHGTHSSYPPLVPVLAVLFVKLFGVGWGTWTLAALAGIVPGAGAYVVLSRAGLGWWATVLGTVVAASAASGEAVAWGGVPQLLGLGIAALLVWEFATFARHRTESGAARVGGLLFVLAVTSHLVLFQAVATCAAIAVLVGVLRLFSWDRRPGPRRRGRQPRPSRWATRARMAFWMVGPMVVLIPLYARLVTTVAPAASTAANTATTSAMFNEVLWLFRPAPLIWRTALIVSLAAPLLLCRWRAHTLWLVSAGGVITMAGLVVLGHQTRFVYLTPFAVASSLGVWVLECRSFLRRAPIRLVAAVAIAGLAVAGTAVWRELAFFPSQRDWYGAAVPKGTTAALDWLRTHTPAQATVAVASDGGRPFGWWVEGYGRRSALVGSSAQWLYFPEERARAATVTKLLSTTAVLGDATLVAARANKIAYLYFPSGWQGFDLDALRTFDTTHPGLVVFTNRAAVIVKVPS